MTTPLPPRVSRSRFDQALKALAGVVGAPWVFTSEEDRLPYHDAYSPGFDGAHSPSAAVAPASVEQVQAVVRIANEYKVPLSPISRGRNLTYGGAAPRQSGAVVLDLGRLNRIHEVNPELAYCRIEPGVGFYDLHDHIRSRQLPLWMSVPVQAWGSVIGNALDRGLGLTNYGEHTQQLCGLEVVLPTGELVRTGMGAMKDNPNWNTFRHGFGPSWDQMFAQSNFGVVTQAGVWLMPAPEATLSYRCKVMKRDDLASVIDLLVPLRQRGIIDQYMSIVSHSLIAASVFPRSEFTQETGPMSDATSRKIMAAMNTGWWNFDICLYGDPEVNRAKARVIERAFTKHGGIEFERSEWQQGEDPKRSNEPVPDVFALNMVNWYGGRGGHMDFSPVVPAQGKLVVEQAERVRARFDAAGHDYVNSFHIGARHVLSISPVLYDRDNAPMVDRAKRLFNALLEDAVAHRYGVYRAHLRHMDPVARSFDFNDHALLRLQQRVKDALDPNGILAPGKSGIWPQADRTHREMQR